MRTFALLTAIFLLGIGIQPCHAAAAWKCGKKHCFWVEGYTGPVPDFAAGWAPPQAPGCYYARNPFVKSWSQVCPPPPG